MTEIELLELVVLGISDLHTSVTMDLSAIQVRQDASAGYIHLGLAGLAICVFMLTYIAVMVSRR